LRPAKKAEAIASKAADSAVALAAGS